MHDTMKVNGYTVAIKPDYDPINPRDADHLGVMYCEHSRYVLGDTSQKRLIEDWVAIEDAVAEWRRRELSFSRLARYLRWVVGATVVLPLYLLDHSGLAMRTGPFIEDYGGWDSGVVGFICDTAITRNKLGVEKDDVECCLQAEVLEYSAYLQGLCVGYVISHTETCNLGHEHEEIDDSCWGFLLTDSFGFSDVVKQATEAANALPAREES